MLLTTFYKNLNNPLLDFGSAPTARVYQTTAGVVCPNL